MPWIVKLDKERLHRQVGARARRASAACASGSSASRCPRGACRPRARRSSSTAGSPAASRASRSQRGGSAKSIGLAWVPTELAADGAEIDDPRRRARSRRRPCTWRRSTTRRASGCAHEPARVPLARARPSGGSRRRLAARAHVGHAPAGVADRLATLGKLEVRGDVERRSTVGGAEVVPLAPGRCLVARGTRRRTAAARDRLVAPRAVRVYDMTAALAALELRGRASCCAG